MGRRRAAARLLAANGCAFQHERRLSLERLERRLEEDEHLSRSVEREAALALERAPADHG